MEEVVFQRVLQLLQDRMEDLVVEREVAVRVGVNEPAGEGGLRAGQLTLDSVLGQDGHRLLAKGAVPREGCTLQNERTQKPLLDQTLYV